MYLELGIWDSMPGGKVPQHIQYFGLITKTLNLNNKYMSRFHFKCYSYSVN